MLCSYFLTLESFWVIAVLGFFLAHGDYYVPSRFSVVIDLCFATSIGSLEESSSHFYSLSLGSKLLPPPAILGRPFVD